MTIFATLELAEPLNNAQIGESFFLMGYGTKMVLKMYYF